MFDRGGLIGLATLALYLWLAPDHIVDGDNAEFATLGAVGGVPHPSGYPLYLLWLRATAWLPAASPAHAAAIATALLGVVLVLVLHAACRAWGARAQAASFAVAMFAAAPAVLRIHTEAEVFALNGLVVATVLWLSARHGPLRGAWRVGALALVAGLGLSDHLTCVLVAPVGLLGAVRGVRETERARPAVVALGLGALVLGLTPYLALFAAPTTDISWGHIDSFRGLADHFLRRAYGGPGAFSPHGGEIRSVANLVALARTLGRTWLWLPLGIGLVTLAARVARPGERESRWAWSLLAVSFLLAGPLLVARFDVRPIDLGLYAIRRFHVLPALLLAIPVAVGLDAVGSRVLARIPAAGLRTRPIAALVTTLGFSAVAGTSLPHLLRVHSPAAELAMRNLLRSLPPNAVVIESQELFHYGTTYLQLALGERPDVTIVHWPLMPSRWYRERCARHGIVLDEQGEGVASVRVAEEILAQGRPLFVDDRAANIVQALPSYPFGLVFRILPHGTPRPPIEEVLAINKQLYAGFELGYRRPGFHDEFATEVHERYAETWQIIGKALAAAGKRDEAAWAFDVAAQVGPE